MIEVSHIDTGDFVISELYVDGGRLVITAQSYGDQKLMTNYAEPAADVISIAVPQRAMSQTKVMVYNIENISRPRMIKSYVIEGDAVTSRKVDDSFYMVTSAYLPYEDGKYILPGYTSALNGTQIKSIDVSELSYFPESTQAVVTTIAAIDLENVSADVDMESYLGISGTVFMSRDNLYITTESYTYMPNRPYAASNRTNIYKFALDGASIGYASRGSVEGSVLNQFSMDEYQDHFRIATSSWTNSGHRSNNMFVLDSNLKTVGKINNIAPNENIYSVRFLGDKAHMVTFEQTDPLFVIDLKNPENPVILGELKMPGFSTYLHPYDENHLIGFGYDTEVIDGSVVQNGLKLSMFDITDLSAPKELFTTLIGDRGTNAGLLYNHKELLFSKEKNIFAFPVEVLKIDNKTQQKDQWTYGNFEFQGAYVYGIDLTEGFNLKGTITNSKTGAEGDYNDYVQRIIYIGDNFYTASNGRVKATDMNSFETIGEFVIK
jgi:uncharacterized secreted protein with C-terminal beta-propeller domain